MNTSSSLELSVSEMSDPERGRSPPQESVCGRELDEGRTPTKKPSNPERDSTRGLSPSCCE